MGEFQGFSDILKQFSTKQKFIVLLVLLVFSAVISLGTTFINGYYKSSEELTIIVNSQKKSIIDLNKRVNELQMSIISNSQSCTDSILASEKRHADDILSQQRYLNEMLSRLKLQVVEQSKKVRLSTMQSYVEQEGNVLTGDSLCDNGTDRILNSINIIQSRMKRMVRK